MKLGKKLEVTDIKERMKLLIDGEIFIDREGLRKWAGEGCFLTETFTQGDELMIIDSSDWYYPAKTYTINGVELVDERVMNIGHEGVVYPINTFAPEEPKKDTLRNISFVCGSLIVDGLLRTSQLHRTKEAATAHAKAMIQVQESSK